VTGSREDRLEVSLLAPRGPTTVRLDRADIVLELTEQVDRAKVRASYQLTETSSAPADVELMVLPLGTTDDQLAPAPILFTVDGVAVPVVVERSPGPSFPPDPAWKLDGRWGTARLDLTKVSFQAGQTRVVELRYEHPGQLTDRVGEPRSYEIACGPAAGWAGVGPLDLSFRIPPGARLETSFPLLRRAEAEVGSHISLPSGTVSILARAPGSVWLGITDYGTYWWILGVTCFASAILMGAIVGRASARADRRWVRIVLGSIGWPVLGLMASAAAAFGLLAAMPRFALGNGMVFLGVLFILAATVPAAGLSALGTWALEKRRIRRSARDSEDPSRGL
jgi:hypothetical protein